MSSDRDDKLSLAEKVGLAALGAVAIASGAATLVNHPPTLDKATPAARAASEEPDSTSRQWKQSLEQGKPQPGYPGR